MGRGFAWLDTGTPHSLSEAAIFIEVVESQQKIQVACLEEIAFRKGWITRKQLFALAEPMQATEYGQYIIRLCNEKHAQVFGGQGK